MKNKIEDKAVGVVKIYNFTNLSDEAKEKARDWFRGINDYPMLESHLTNLVKEELDKRGIKYDTDSIRCFYSLSHNQGDGLMFEGVLYDKRGNEIKIKHSGRYYHEYCKEIDYPTASEKQYADFEKVYVAICKTVARAGYEEIEYQDSAEYVDEYMEANEYTFTQEGKRMDCEPIK